MRTGTRRLLARLRVPAVAYGDLRAMRRPVAVARALRIVLAVVLARLPAAATVAAAHAGSSRSELVPQSQGNVLVIDLSKSILDTDFVTIGATLRRLIATDTPTGLVVFSDVPYELLPPGSPATALAPILR